MKKVIAGFIVLNLSLGISLGSVVVAQNSTTSSSARQQAILHLGQLVDTYGVTLNSVEKDRVQTICRELQSSTLDALSVQVNPMRVKYLGAIDTLDSNIKFITNSLREMSEDSSNLDLASIHLDEIRQDFESTLDPYSKALNELLVIDCQIFPAHFVAGLEEARFRRKLVVAAAEEVIEFRDTELSNALDSVRDRLTTIAEKEAGL